MIFFLKNRMRDKYKDVHRIDGELKLLKTMRSPKTAAFEASWAATDQAIASPERMLARNRDAELAHVGKVQQTHPARRMLLAEDHIAVGAVNICRYQTDDLIYVRIIIRA